MTISLIVYHPFRCKVYHPFRRKVYHPFRQSVPPIPGKKINTSYIERVNGTLRQTDSHLRRKSLTFAKEMPYFKARVALIVLVYNCIKIHITLSKNPDKTFTPRTPALAAKLIEKNWTVSSAFTSPLII